MTVKVINCFRFFKKSYYSFVVYYFEQASFFQDFPLSTISSFMKGYSGYIRKSFTS